MTVNELITLRLSNQQISEAKFTDPADLVNFLGAVQSQDFAGAKWALGLRLPGSFDADIEKSFNEGQILRTHCLRPTWHFVTPENIRWMVELNAPQVKRILSSYNRKLELDESVFQKTNQIIEHVLRGKNLTRTQILAELKKHGYTGTGQRMGHIVGWAELDNIICSGPRIGKQFTYALTKERVANVKKISREEALVKLTKIFFSTRGPATIKDFSKWSGLSQTEIKKGIGMITPKFLEATIDNQIYYFANSTLAPKQKSPTAYLLPNYDEYISSYSDYSLIADLEKAKNINTARNPSFWNHLIIDGLIEGSWRRVIKKDVVEIELETIRDLSKIEMESVHQAIEKFGRFWGTKTQLLQLPEHSKPHSLK